MEIIELPNQKCIGKLRKKEKKLRVIGNIGRGNIKEAEIKGNIRNEYL